MKNGRISPQPSCIQRQGIITHYSNGAPICLVQFRQYSLFASHLCSTAHLSDTISDNLPAMLTLLMMANSPPWTSWQYLSESLNFKMEFQNHKYLHFLTTFESFLVSSFKQFPSNFIHPVGQFFLIVSSSIVLYSKRNVFLNLVSYIILMNPSTLKEFMYLDTNVDLISFACKCLDINHCFDAEFLISLPFFRQKNNTFTISLVKKVNQFWWKSGIYSWWLF